MMSRQEFLQDVAFLAEKYGFDAEEANRLLASDDLKLARKRGPEAKAKKEPKPKKEPKSDDDKPKPKRAKTGYLLYADKVRESVRAQLTGDLCLDDGMKLRPQEVVTAIAVWWKSEDQWVRDQWNETASIAQEDAALAMSRPEEA